MDNFVHLAATVFYTYFCFFVARYYFTQIMLIISAFGGLYRGE